MIKGEGEVWSGTNRPLGVGTCRARTWGFLAAASFAVTACGWGVDHTKSGFASLNGDQVDRTLTGETNWTVSDPAVGTVAFMTGYNYRTTGGSFNISYGTYFAFAGIAPGYDVGAPMTGGAASYDADYAYLVVDNVNDTWFGIYGTDIARSGSIALAADFDAGTLTGAATGLTVDGTIKGGKLSGNVEVIFYPASPSGSVTGTLIGYVGNTGTIGAFHGSDSDTVAAGGFVGTAN